VTRVPDFAIISRHMRDTCDGLPGDFMYVDRRTRAGFMTRQFDPLKWQMTCLEPVYTWNALGGLNPCDQRVQHQVAITLSEVMKTLTDEATALDECVTCGESMRPYANRYGFALLHKRTSCRTVLKFRPNDTVFAVPRRLVRVA
jgi:hypothetical protein